MKKFQYVLFFLTTVFCSGHEILSLPVPCEEEVLFLNRIADFWEEGEYSIAKHQIQEFIHLYPESHFADVLHAAIGEIYLRERNYREALDSYAKIKDEQIATTIFPHRAECLYNMQWYPVLADECEAHLQNLEEGTPSFDEIATYLAMSLYQQCTLTPDLKTAQTIQARANPFFQKLLAKEHPIELATSYAHLLWMAGEIPTSAAMYLSLANDHPERLDLQEEAALIQLELIQFYHKNGEWEKCHHETTSFLSRFPNHPQTAIAFQFLIGASAEQANTGAQEKEQFVSVLEKALEHDPENETYLLLLAKTRFALHEFTTAIPLFEELLKNRSLSEKDASEVALLLAFSYRDGVQNFEKFCEFGEKALELAAGTSFLDTENLHSALYNGYLELQNFDRAEEHLFSLFEQGKADPETLPWLGGRYFEKRFEDPQKRDRALAIFKIMPPKETTILPLCELYIQLDQKDLAIATLENWIQENPSPKALFLLAEQYTDPAKALPLLQEVCKTKSSLRTYEGAAAALKSVKLQMLSWDPSSISTENPEVEKTLLQLKDLILQKTCAHEPLYLEAALEYIDLQNKCHKCPTKNFFLLQKIKKDFENSDDLISKEYHLQRQNSIEKNKIYQSYICFLDALICLSKIELENDEEQQKQLQAKSKDLLLRVIEGQASLALVARAERCLKQ